MEVQEEVRKLVDGGQLEFVYVVYKQLVLCVLVRDAGIH